MDLIKLNIVGYSRSEFQHGAYALILSEDMGNRDLSIVIGACEAQSIAIGLESNITVNRPLTHDLFKSFANSFNIKLKHIYIYKIEDGIFYSFLVFNKNKKDLKIDSRTSDAVAISIRFKVPIYTNEKVLKQTTSIEKSSHHPKKKYKLKSKLDSNISERLNPIYPDETTESEIHELKKKLQEALDIENYKLAAKIRDLINKKSGK